MYVLYLLHLVASFTIMLHPISNTTASSEDKIISECPIESTFNSHLPSKSSKSPGNPLNRVANPHQIPNSCW